MDTTKRPPLDRLLFATFLKGRTSSRDPSIHAILKPVLMHRKIESGG